VVVLSMHISIFCKVSRHCLSYTAGVIHSLWSYLYIYDFIIQEFLRISLSKDYISHIERLSKVVAIFREQLCIV